MNWGILATGTIANKFATTVNAMAAEGERLAAVGSRRAESAKAFAAQYNIPHWHASYEELAADPAVSQQGIYTVSFSSADVNFNGTVTQDILLEYRC